MSCGMQVLVASLIGAAVTGQTAVRTEDFKLVPSDADAGFGLGFGLSLAASDDWIVVGAPLDEEGAPWPSGALYVYRREAEGWVEHVKLFSPPVQSEFELGWAVATDGDRIVAAGDVLFDLLNPRPGAVYVYRRDDAGTPHKLADDQWAFDTRIPGERSGNFTGEGLGASVAIQQDVLVAGTLVLLRYFLTH